MELKEFLKKQPYNMILRFFHENPGSIDTARGLAAWTNQDIKNVRAALKRLATDGFLTAHKASSTTAYSYTRNKKLISVVAKLFSS